MGSGVTPVHGSQDVLSLFQGSDRVDCYNLGTALDVQHLAASEQTPQLRLHGIPTSYCSA